MPLVVVVAVTVAVSRAFVLGSCRELRNIEFKYIYQAACGPLAGQTRKDKRSRVPNGYNGLSLPNCYEVRTDDRGHLIRALRLRGTPMPHPAQIRDAVQVYIERQDRPVRSWQIQDEIANRLDTRHALVYTALKQLEQDGRVCKHVSPESGAEFWFSPRSETFCATCGQLALPGVHTQPECPRRKQ